MKIIRTTLQSKIYLLSLLFFVLLGINVVVLINQFLNLNRILNLTKIYHNLYEYIDNFESIFQNQLVNLTNLVNVSSKEQIVQYTNSIRNYNFDFDEKYDNYLKLTFENIDKVNTVNIYNINDSLLAVLVLYKNNLLPLIHKVEDNINLIYKPEIIYQNYKILVQEQLNLGNLMFSDLSKYTTSEVVDKLQTIYKLNTIDTYKYVYKQLKNILSLTNSMKHKINHENIKLYKSYNITKFYYIITILLFFSLLFFVSFVIYLNKMLVSPLKTLNNTIKNLSLGMIPEKMVTDEINELSILYENINALIDYLKQTSDYAIKLANDELDNSITLKNENDFLTNSLVLLREKLVKTKSEENRRISEELIRQRSSEALSKFNDILRLHQNDINTLAKVFVSEIVKFLSASQAMLFILNEKDDYKYLKCVATYAWDREKFVDKIEEIGSGLIGSVVVDKFTVYMTNIPEDYFEIKSGIGSTNPKAILITPIKAEDEVLGVLEIASLNTFQEYEIKLVESICQSVGATLKTVQINTKTAELLESFQIQAYEVKEQEELLKSKIEELKSKELEYSKKEKELTEKINELEELLKSNNSKLLQFKKDYDQLKNDFDKSISQIELLNTNIANLIEMLDIGVIILDEKLNIKTINSYLLNKLNFSYDDILNSNVSVISEEITQDLFQKEKAGVEEILVKLKDKYNNFISFLLKNYKTVIDGKNEYFLILKPKEVEYVEDEIKSAFYDELSKMLLESLVKVNFYEKYFIDNKLELPKNLTFENQLFIEWSSSYETGISLIDKQHQKWINIINDLYSIILAKEKTDKVVEFFKKLTDYTEYHFGFEEKYMKEFKFEYYDSHLLQHEKFIVEITNLFNNYLKSENKDIPFRMLLFIKNWVINHITKTDFKYIDNFKAHGLK